MLVTRSSHAVDSFCYLVYLEMSSKQKRFAVHTMASKIRQLNLFWPYLAFPSTRVHLPIYHFFVWVWGWSFIVFLGPSLALLAQLACFTECGLFWTPG